MRLALGHAEAGGHGDFGAGVFEADGGDGERLATRDGLLVVRFLLGLRGNALIQGAAAASGTRTTAADIEAYLALLTPPL